MKSPPFFVEHHQKCRFHICEMTKTIFEKPIENVQSVVYNI